MPVGLSAAKSLSSAAIFVTAAVASLLPCISSGKEYQMAKILHIEDNRFVAGAVADTLDAEGWRVETVVDGWAGMRQIEGTGHYDLIILDYDLPGHDGMALTRRVRELEHRRQTPIIMLSAAVVGLEARRAGVDVFLKKPEDIYRLVDVVRNLINRIV
jgi:DNA-binding response OmpR family regulator